MFSKKWFIQTRKMKVSLWNKMEKSPSEEYLKYRNTLQLKRNFSPEENKNATQTSPYLNAIKLDLEEPKNSSTGCKFPWANQWIA